MDQLRTIPAYIGIGFRRCASTWLHECIFQHPHINHYRGDTVWGMHFFSNDEEYAKGIEWYESQLRLNAGKHVIGELSDSYTYPEVYQQVAERIHRHYPQVKLLCIVRNPVDRVYSDYLRSLVTGELKTSVSFEEAIERDPRYIERGLYAQILTEYRDYLADNRLLVLFQENLRTDPFGVVQLIYRYLGVDEEFVPPVISEVKGHAIVPRSTQLQFLIMTLQNRGSQLFRGLKLGIVLGAIKSLGIQKAILNLNRSKNPEMQQGTRQKLLRIYHESNLHLSELLGCDLTMWQE